VNEIFADAMAGETAAVAAQLGLETSRAADIRYFSPSHCDKIHSQLIEGIQMGRSAESLKGEEKQCETSWQSW
jgi:hypothetical protein